MMPSQVSMLGLVVALALACAPAAAERRLTAGSAISEATGTPTIVSAPTFAAFGPSAEPADSCDLQEINIHVACGNLTLAVDELPFLVPYQSGGNISNFNQEDLRNVSHYIDNPGPVCCQVVDQFAQDACVCDLAVVKEINSINKQPEYPGVVGPAEDQYQLFQHLALFLTVCDLPLVDISTCNPSLPSVAPAVATAPPGLVYNTTSDAGK